MDKSLIQFWRTEMTEISVRSKARSGVVEQLMLFMQCALVCEAVSKKITKRMWMLAPTNSIHFFLPLLFPLPPLFPAAASLVALVSPPVAAASFCFRSKSLATSAFTMS